MLIAAEPNGPIVALAGDTRSQFPPEAVAGDAVSVERRHQGVGQLLEPAVDHPVEALDEVVAAAGGGVVAREEQGEGFGGHVDRHAGPRPHRRRAR